MSIYADTSVLFSLYGTDANSPHADAWRQANPAPLDFTGLQRVELRNALALAVFQQRLTPSEAHAAWQEVQRDLATGLLVSRPEPWTEVFGRAETLVRDYSETVGSQSLDILHVATALVWGATTFCTFDIRQARLARLAGLQVQSL